MKNKYQAPPSPDSGWLRLTQFKWGQSNYLLSIRGRKYLVYLLCGIAFQIIFFLIFFCFKWDRSGKQSYFNIFLGGIEDWHICSGTDNSGIKTKNSIGQLMKNTFYFLWLTSDFYMMSMSRSTLELNNCQILERMKEICEMYVFW